MPRSPRPLALVFATALLAGCGGASPDQPAVPKGQAAKQAAPVNGGQLKVGVTDGGIGTATEGGAGGLKTLPNGPVEGQSNTEQGVGAGAGCKNTLLAPTKDNLAAIAASTLCLLNGERQDKGLAPLKPDAKLASAALQHSQDMVARRYFDHVAKDGSDPVSRIRKTGYLPRFGAWTVGENLGWGTGSLASPKEMVKAWMNSQGHRENILRPQFKEIGLGVAVGNPRSNDGGATYTTTFGGITGARVAGHRKARKGHRSAKRARASAKRARASRVRTHKATARAAKRARISLVEKRAASRR